MTATEWLASERDYEVGRQLYDALGDNERLKRLYAGGANTYNRESVLWELTKLARAGVVTPVRREPGLDDYGNRIAPLHFFLPLAEAEELQNATKPLQKDESPPQKVESLSPEAGKLLDELRDARRLLYDERTGVHAQLEGAANEEERRQMCSRITKLSRQIDANWNADRHVRAHGTLPPGPVAAPELATLPADKLLKKRNNLRSQVSKLKKQPHRADDLMRVEAELHQVESLLNPS
jgi:hypothetical protein